MQAYQLNYSPATNEMTNNFGTTSSIIDLTNRYSENKEKTTNHTFQLDYTMPLGTGQTLSLGSKMLLHDATSDSRYLSSYFVCHYMNLGKLSFKWKVIIYNIF